MAGQDDTTDSVQRQVARLQVGAQEFVMPGTTGSGPANLSLGSLLAPLSNEYRAPAFVPGGTGSTSVNPSAPVFQPSVDSPTFTPGLPSGSPQMFGQNPVPQSGDAAYNAYMQHQPGLDASVHHHGDIAASFDDPPQPYGGGGGGSSHVHHPHGNAHHAHLAHHQPNHDHPDLSMRHPDLSMGPPPPLNDAVNVRYPVLLPHEARAQRQAESSPDTASFFMNEALRGELLGRQRAVHMQIEPHAAAGIPAQVDNYHSLYPLEAMNADSGKVFGFPSVLYKAIHSGEGMPYVMRRMVNYRLSDAGAMSCVEQWKKIQHPNIVAVKEVFSTKDFHDNSAVFVHEFHPLAESLADRHLNGRTKFIAESLLWSYIIQLTAALRAIHGAGLACRVVDPSKILVTGRSRIAIGSTCIYDVLQYDETQTTAAAINHYQQKDLDALGHVIHSTLMPMFRDSRQHAMAHVQSNYSNDLLNVLGYLLYPAPGRMRNLNELMPMIGARFYMELETQSMHTTLLERDLARELHNGRLFRLATKLAFIVDRPEHTRDPRWADTGDRFLLKLLKDYIFHQVEPESGTPWLDLSHVVQCLNKLDTGAQEKICLVTPDEKNIMVVSYADLKACINKAYVELL